MHLRAVDRREDSDDGFTILEVVAALGLIAFVMASLTSLFYGAMKVAIDSNVRSQAVGVATRALESFRVAAYSEVGFYEDQTDYDANCDATAATAETVTLGAVAPAEAKYVPSEVLNVASSNIDFRVTRCVVWVDARNNAGTLLPDAYKMTSVRVDWTDAAGKPHDISQRSVLYPGGLGVSSPQDNGTSSGGSPVAPSAPFNLAANPPAPPAGETQVDLTWSSATDPHHFEIEWADTNGFTTILGVQDTPSGTARSLSVTGLAPGTQYYFRVTAYGDAAEAAGSSASNSDDATTWPAGSATCTVGALSIVVTDTTSTTKIYLTSSGRLGSRLNVSLALSGVCTAAYSVQAKGPAPSTTVKRTWTLSGSGGVRTENDNEQNETWATGVYSFVALENSVGTSSQHSFLVCARDTTPNPDPNVC